MAVSSADVSPGWAANARLGPAELTTSKQNRIRFICASPCVRKLPLEHIRFRECNVKHQAMHLEQSGFLGDIPFCPTSFRKEVTDNYTNGPRLGMPLGRGQRVILETRYTLTATNASLQLR